MLKAQSVLRVCTLHTLHTYVIIITYTCIFMFTIIKTTCFMIVIVSGTMSEYMNPVKV